MEYQVVVLGSGGAGKSALILQFLTGEYHDVFDPTLEEYYRKVIEVDGKLGELQILDSAGTDEFSAMRDLYIKNGQGFLLIYSIVNQMSFIDVQRYRDRIHKVKGSTAHVPMILVGTKCDLEAKRVVSTIDGESLSRQWGIPFYEASAKTKKNVNVIFLSIVQEIIRHGHNGGRKEQQELRRNDITVQTVQTQRE